MYSIIELRKDSIIELCRVRTVEEKYYMLKKWQDYLPNAKVEACEISGE